MPPLPALVPCPFRAGTARAPAALPPPSSTAIAEACRPSSGGLGASPLAPVPGPVELPPRLPAFPLKLFPAAANPDTNPPTPPALRESSDRLAP